MGSEDLDDAVLLLVFGWKRIPTERDDAGYRTYCVGDGTNTMQNPPKPTRSVADDYNVLVRIRETWDVQAFANFCGQLRHIHHDRIRNFMRHRKWNVYRDGNRAEALYEPGDYSRAALAAVEDDE